MSFSKSMIRAMLLMENAQHTEQSFTRQISAATAAGIFQVKDAGLNL